MTTHDGKPAARLRGPGQARLLSCRAVLASAVTLSFFSPQSASACGGLFCNAASPVNQTAERIIFAQDDEQNVTQIVEILYEGPSEKFAWVLPVPGTPEVGVSSKVILDRLQQATNPTYQFNNIQANSCPNNLLSNPIGGVTADAAGSESGDYVNVIDSGAVGPYEYETIKVSPDLSDPAQVAVDWLQLNGYDVGELGADVLRPYLANGLNLIAVRLQKGTDSGSIRPLTLKYQSRALAIPIRPTAVAANDDMGVMVWILGASRAVPVNYYGLELNDLLIDWFNPGNTYDQVVTEAANEAGGQGFVTEMAGSSAGFEDRLYFGESLQDQDFALQNYGRETWMQNLASINGSYDGFSYVIDRHVSLRDGVTTEQFISQPYCYFQPDYYCDTAFGTVFAQDDPFWDTDFAALEADLESYVFEPLRETAALFSQFPYMTRLYTTMSASDMTLDPTFDFNSELPDVSNRHTADRYLTCEGVGGDWKVVLPSGRVVYGTGFTWPYTLNDDFPVNAVVTQFAPSGAGDVVEDNAELITSRFRASKASEPTSAFKEKGCSVAGAPGRPSALNWGWLMAAAAALVLSQRRRQALKAK